MADFSLIKLKTGQLKKTRARLPMNRFSGGIFSSRLNLQFSKAGSKFVLFIGDEGTILIYIKDSVVQNRQFIGDTEAENLKEFNKILAQDTNAPIMLIVDSMDQSYTHQTLPPVSALAINKLIKRRLDRDFGPNTIKGAIVLGREDTERKDWEFLMIALEKSPQLTFWVDFVSELPNRFQGIYLVSAETENIIRDLELAMGVPKEGTGSEWKFFVSHNKVGGFRQVIMRNGRLIFTRMAQPIGESTPEVIAGNIEQEMLNTMEYMRRLTFTPEAGLDIYIIASANLKPLIDPAKFGASNFSMLTPYETAQYLGIEGATQPTDQFGDVILGSAIARYKRHVLTLIPPELQKFSTLYQLIALQRMVAAAIVLGSVLYGADTIYDMYNLYSKKDDLQETVATREKNLEALRAEIKATHMDVERVADLIDLYQTLQKEKQTPLPFIAAVADIIKQPIALKSLDWSTDEKPSPKGPKMTAVFTLNFPGVQNPDMFKAASKKMLSSLKEALKGYDIAFTRIPRLFSESEKLDLSLDEKIGAPAEEQSDVQLTIKGDIMAPPTPTPAAPPVAALAAAPAPSQTP